MVTTRTYTDGSGRTPEYFVSDINGDSQTNMAVWDTISSIGDKIGKYSKEK